MRGLWSCQNWCCYENGKYNIYMRICERKLDVWLSASVSFSHSVQFELSKSIFIGVIISFSTAKVSVYRLKSEPIEGIKKRGAEKKDIRLRGNNILFIKKNFFSLTHIKTQNWPVHLFGSDCVNFHWKFQFYSILFRFVRVINYLVFSSLISYIWDLTHTLIHQFY